MYNIAETMMLIYTVLKPERERKKERKKK